MDILNETKAAVKIGAGELLKQYKWYLLIGLIAIGAFLFIAFTIGTYHPDQNSQVVQDLLNKMITDEKEKYEQTIKDKDTQISNINKQLSQSQAKVNSYTKEIEKLKGELDKIKPPANAQEVRDRLRELGYETK